MSAGGTNNPTAQPSASQPERSGADPGAPAGIPPSPGSLAGSGGAEPGHSQPRQRDRPPAPRRHRLPDLPRQLAVRASGRAAGPAGSAARGPGAPIPAAAGGRLPPPPPQSWRPAPRGYPRAPRCGHPVPARRPRSPFPHGGRAPPLPLFAAPPGAAAARRPRNRHLCGVAPTYRLTKTRPAAGREGGEREGAGWLFHPLSSRPVPSRAVPALPWPPAPRPPPVSHPRSRLRHPRAHRRFRATRPRGRRGGQWAAAPRWRAALVGAGRSQWEAAPPRRFTTSGYGRPRGLRAPGTAGGTGGRAGGQTRGEGAVGPVRAGSVQGAPRVMRDHYHMGLLRGYRDPRPRPAAPQHAAAAALRGSGSRSLSPAASPHARTPSFSSPSSSSPPTHSAGERDRPGTTPMNNPHRLARRGRSGAGGAGIAVPFPLPPWDHTPLARGEVRPPSRFWAEGALGAVSPGGRAEAAQTGAHPTPVSPSPALRPSLNLSCPASPHPSPRPSPQPSSVSVCAPYPLAN
ncbi:basic proline-rich protein-like [Corapipo altera]|uniref:basic proline-rich protein-like n=1 Tax=Corapipo altera TaxID=415028 RepID=UPI000FD622C0|nr:basic proline-rich protein-like [Corapipo altera]